MSTDGFELLRTPHNPAPLGQLREHYAGMHEWYVHHANSLTSGQRSELSAALAAIKHIASDRPDYSVDATRNQPDSYTW